MTNTKQQCDNTDCENKSKKLYHIILTEDFENDECDWCEDCIRRDFDMIETVMDNGKDITNLFN